MCRAGVNQLLALQKPCKLFLTVHFVGFFQKLIINFISTLVRRLLYQAPRPKCGSIFYINNNWILRFLVYRNNHFWPLQRRLVFLTNQNREKLLKFSIGTRKHRPCLSCTIEKREWKYMKILWHASRPMPRCHKQSLFSLVTNLTFDWQAHTTTKSYLRHSNDSVVFAWQWILSCNADDSTTGNEDWCSLRDSTTHSI